MIGYKRAVLALNWRGILSRDKKTAHDKFNRGVADCQCRSRVRRRVLYERHEGKDVKG
jgi:hypothetical protein